uniref:DH domain-containing protein n=1 Tax=Arcella intermedia TaxID=1963864 RepID=A0A6B2L7H5_9EUKA
MSGDQSVKGKRNQKEMIMSPPLKRRGFVLSEILSTERSYVSGLSIILNVYQKPAVEGFFITQEDIDKIILPIVETIYALHQNLLKSLEERIGDLHGTDDPLVAEIFESFIPVVVPLYSAYLLNFDLATTQLKKLRESFHLFDAFLKVQKQTELAHKKDLDSYLITIVQRLPRYVLLFKELVQNTPKSHVEYNRLVKLYQRIQETVSTIDHEKKKSQQKDESIRLHIMFGLEKEMPQTRTLVYAAELSITRDKRGHRSKHPMFIKPLNSRKFRLLLFNDIIMLARYVKDDGEELVLVKRYQLLETTINTYIMEDSDNTAIKFANSIYYTPNANARDELLDAYAQLMASYAQIFGHL